VGEKGRGAIDTEREIEGGRGVGEKGRGGGTMNLERRGEGAFLLRKNPSSLFINDELYWAEMGHLLGHYFLRQAL
jgi:hypothetical protein